MEIHVPVAPDFSRIHIPAPDAKADLTLCLFADTPGMPRLQNRPMVIVCPGGAYCFTAGHEAEPVAAKFMAQGMQAAVLRYHTAPDFHDPVPVLELAWSVQYVRQHADAFHVNPDAVFVIGFSAGAHLVAHLCTRWRDPVFQQVLTPGISWRPDAQILCYPVISMMDFAHEGSCCNLLGERASDPLERDRCSLERHVSSDVPPTFLWHTVEDESVPVENSMMYASALRRSGVPFEMHLFEQGRHGLSTCDDTVSDSDSGILPDNAVWVDMAVRFLKRRIHFGGSAYGTVEQGS